MADSSTDQFALGSSYWLKDKLISILDERSMELAEYMAKGVPTEEYRQFVGKWVENRRMKDTVLELFAEFYADEADMEGDLEEMGEDPNAT